MESNFGTRKWIFADFGISYEVLADHARLSDVIEKLLDPSSAERLAMEVQQIRHYPKPVLPGRALKVMFDTVRRYARLNS